MSSDPFASRVGNGMLAHLGSGAFVGLALARNKDLQLDVVEHYLMAFVKVGSLASLPPGSVTEVTLGEDSYAICNLNGELHALAGICPHAGGPIGQGNLQENLVICPWHEWAYDCRTGENDYDPTVKLDRFPVKTEGDDILIDPQARA